LAIVFDNVSKIFGRRRALDGLSFTAESGQITGLLGRNGAGKTTALRVLVGLEKASFGDALIDGSRFEDLPLGYVGVALSPNFPPTRTVMQQVALASMAGSASKQDIERTLMETELTEVAHKRSMSLSLGMKQRLLLACATVARPRVLILDEPVNGLDPDGIAWLHSYLKDQASKGVAVLVSSHYLNDLQTYADRIVIIQRTSLWDGVWPNENEASLETLFQRITKGLKVS
jgi:ABC-2 type transport system ATP-binding protein